MVSPLSVLDLFAALLLFATLCAIRDHRRRGGLPYPPGPRPLPIIGNILHIPKDFSWLAYIRFSEIYGNILSFHIFGQVIVVLNTIEDSKDLLEKHGDKCADRPHIPIVEMAGWQMLLQTATYGESYRLARKLLDRGLRPGAAAQYRPMQQSKARILLSRLLENPDEWEAHFELLQGELILAMTYGYEAQGRNDRRVELARHFSDVGSQSVLPGALLVNDLPFLRHIPEWLPWLSYKPLARLGHDLAQETMHAPIRFVKESMLNGTAKPSLALQNLQDIETLSGSERQMAEETVAGALGSMYTAGADTTVSALMSLLLAVILHPDTQKRAQEELDTVTGRERLPTFEDRPRLPFVDAMCKEVMRWRPVTPLGIPHAALEDIVYKGYFIPRGAAVIGNTWAILNDPSMYPEPEVFKPERFLNLDGSSREDPILASAFGFGRRICPGRHFVDATLFITVASLFSVFNIQKGQGADGEPFTYSFTGSLVSRPNSFPCSIIPRDKCAEQLIRADSMAS
ncbi:cytochrome P450 [Lactifluus volemus]|nr:cytochrome P450 [Lactifluus volemus]